MLIPMKVIKDELHIEYIKTIYKFYLENMTGKVANGSMINFFHSKEYEPYEKKYNILSRKEKIERLMNEKSR